MHAIYSYYEKLYYVAAYARHQHWIYNDMRIGKYMCRYMQFQIGGEDNVLNASYCVHIH